MRRCARRARDIDGLSRLIVPDMATTRELVTGTVLYGATEVLNKFIVFALLPLLTAYLSPADFGIQAIVTGLTILLTPIISLGIGASLAPCYFLHEDADHR